MGDDKKTKELLDAADVAIEKLRIENAKEPINTWFELTYSNYLVLPRSLLEGMPVEWQTKFVALLGEMQEVYDCSKIDDNYTTHLVDENGNHIHDPFADYRRPAKLPYRDDSNKGSVNNNNEV